MGYNIILLISTRNIHVRASVLNYKGPDGRSSFYYIDKLRLTGLAANLKAGVSIYLGYSE